VSVSCSCRLCCLRCFPTRRSSDLPEGLRPAEFPRERGPGADAPARPLGGRGLWLLEQQPGGAGPRRHLVVVRGAIEPAHREVERSEEHTSELQSLAYLVCRLLLEK